LSSLSSPSWWLSLQAPTESETEVVEVDLGVDSAPVEEVGVVSEVLEEVVVGVVSEEVAEEEVEEDKLSDMSTSTLPLMRLLTPNPE